jgi:hypothetical protein
MAQLVKQISGRLRRSHAPAGLTRDRGSPQCPRLPTDLPHPSAAQEIRQALEAQDRAEAPADLLSELTAMADCAIVLARLDADPQARVLRWLVARFVDDAPLPALR